MEKVSSQRRERKKSEVKSRIVKSALKLFFVKGFSDTSIAEVMQDADLGTGTFYNYFQSKEDLVTYCIEEKVSLASSKVETIKDKPITAAQKMSEILLTAGKVFEESRPLMGLYLQTKRKNPEFRGLPSHNHLFKEVIIAVFRQGQESGEFKKKIPAEEVSEIIFGILQSTATGKSAKRAFLESLKTKLDIVFEGILNQGNGA